VPKKLQEGTRGLSDVLEKSDALRESGAVERSAVRKNRENP
jgi:hypothetical protein